MNSLIWGRWLARLFQKRRFSRQSQLLQRHLGCEMLEDRTTPATINWKGTAGNGLWSTASNWDLGRAPTAGDDLVFGALGINKSTIDDIGGAPVFNSITFAASGYTLASSSAAPKIVLGGAINVGSNLGTEIISSDIQLFAPLGTLQQTITVNSGSNLNVTGHIDGRNDANEGAQTLTKAFPGTLTLSSDNSAYTGAITLANGGGIVVMTDPNALGKANNAQGNPQSGPTTVNFNSQLQLKNLAAPVAHQLILNGVGVANDGALLNLQGNNSWNGTITLDNDAAIGGTFNTNLTINGLITDTGAGHSLTKKGQGKVILNEVGGNTYRGQTIIDNGILTIRDPISLGWGADATKPQSGSPQSGTIVNYNSTTGDAGTLQFEFTTLSGSDPNAILQDPTKPFNAATNPVVGFQVFNDLLTLNGPGFNPTNPGNNGAGSLGALNNLAGMNGWDGDVTLGSLPPSTGPVNIGVATNTQLIIAGAVDDPNRQPELRKILPGRLVLSHNDAYDGGTRVMEGALNIRDSQALGTGPVRVLAGAALELEVDQGLDGTPARTHNRNLGFDSVRAAGPGQEIFVPGTTGTFTLTFKGATTGPIAASSPTLAADIQAALNGLTTIGGAGGSVAVTQSGKIFRAIFGGALVGADVPVMTASGSANASINPIYGLTVSNVMDGIDPFLTGGLEGFGLPVTGTAPQTGALHSISGINTYSGKIELAGLTNVTDGSIGVDADIRPGHQTPNTDYFAWDHSLTVTGTIEDWFPPSLDILDRIANGGHFSNLSKFGTGDLILPVANTYSGKTDIKAGWVTVQNNDALGKKVGSQQPLNWQPTTVFAGAALQLKPFPASRLTIKNNMVLAGSGINHPFGLINQGGAVQNLEGTNTLSGIIQLNGNAGIGVEQVFPPAPGDEPSELDLTGYTWDFGTTAGGLTKLGTRRLSIQSPGTFTGPVDIQAGVVLLQHDTGLGATGGKVTVENGASLELGNSLTDQTGGQSFGRGVWGKTLVLKGAGSALFNDTALTVLSNNTATTGPTNNPMVATDNTWRGPISLGTDAVITVRPNSRLILAGPIDDANNLSASGSSITVTGGGVVELSGANTYRGTTFVNQGVLVVGNGQALGGTGNAEVQTLSIVSASAGTTKFTLTFNGQTTTPITYTGVAATDAAAIQSALNALSTIGGTSSVGGVATVAAGATAGVFTVTFGGTLKGFDQALMTGSVTVSPGTIGIVQTTAGAGGTEIANGASLQLAGAITVAGEPLLVHGTGSGATPNVPNQWFQVGPAPIANGGTPSGQNVTGRINAAVADPRNNDVMYIATAGGGAWKTIDGGKTWRPLIDALPEIQAVTVVTPPGGLFSLTFNGQTTTILNTASPTLPIDMQAALTALSTIGGVGGNVTVTHTGNTFRVTFGGTLIGTDVSQMTGSSGVSVNTVQQGKDPRYAMYVGSILIDPNNSNTIYVGTGDPNSTTDTFYGTGIYVSRDAGVTWSLLTDNTGANPFDGKAISKMVIDPFTGTLYVADGDRIAPRNEQQIIEIDFSGIFTLSFTWADATGNVVTQTTIGINTGSPTLRADIENALNALPTINGAVTVTDLGGIFNVTFKRNLANINVPQLVANPPYPLMNIWTQVEGGMSDNNGTTGGPGIWRLQGGTWLNMTSIVSTFRSTTATGQAIAPTPGANPTASPSGIDPIVNTPGPDDDYRMQFPTSNATWTDLALVYVDLSNSPPVPIPGEPVLYAALGTTPADVESTVVGDANSEDINNAVFWTKTPNDAKPIWYVGDPGGSPFSQPPADPTAPDSRTNGFPRGIFAIPVQPPPPRPHLPEFPQNGNIKIAAFTLPNVLGALNVVNELDLNKTILYASVSAPDGSLRALYKSITGGQTWTDVSPPVNYLYNVGNFSNAILASDANTVFVGGQGINAAGQDTILMTTDGGTNWSDISLGGPHAGIHGMSLDSQRRLLVSTDGGLWRRELNGSWTNLNGDLAISLVNGVASNPIQTTSIFAGSQANGTDEFTNSQTWNRVDGYGGGRVAVDPNNAQTVYAVSLLTGTNATLRKSTDGGNTWTSVLAIGNPTAPLVLDTVNSARVLVGGVRLNESINGGASWINLLAPITVSDVAIANAQGDFAIDPDFLQVTDKGANAYDPDTIYVTNGDQIFVTKNHGQSWTDRTGTLAGLGSIVDLEVDPRNRDTIYAVRAAFGGGQVFQSTDAGRTWLNITGTLPNLPTWKIVVDPRNNFLYAGTDEGVFQSTNNGTTWTRFGVGMPNVQVKDMELNLSTNTLLAGTYGRSVFQLFLDTPQTSNAPLNAAVVALSGASIWTGPVILDGDPGTNTVTVGAYGTPNLPNTIPAASLNFLGPISDLNGGANPTVSKIGFGDVIFSGANIYGGQTVVQEGALVVDNAHALGGNANGTTVTSGAVLELRSNLDAEPVTLNGDGLSFDGHFTGSLRNIAGDNTYVGPLTLNTDATIGVDSGSTLTIGTTPSLPGTGTVNGSNNLIKELTGTLVLGSNNAGFSGETQVNRGALRLTNAGALGVGAAGARVLDGAQIQLQSAAGDPPLVVNRPLAVSGTGIFGSGAILNTGGDNTWAGPITFDALPGFSPDTFPVGQINIGVANAGDSLTISGPIGEAETTGLTKVGAGELVLAQANTYSGATEVVQGTVDVRDPNALGLRSGTASIQRVVTLSAEKTGSFRLSFNGVLSNPIFFGATAAQVQTVLNGLSSIGGAGGSVTVTRDNVQTTTQNGPGGQDTGFVYTITFGGTLTNTVVPLTANGQNGTGASASVAATGGIDVRVGNGATLELDATGSPTPNGFTVTGHQLTTSGAGVNGHGSFRNIAGDNTWDGPVVLPVNSTIGVNAGSSMTLSGGVNAAGLNLFKVDPGTLIFPNDPDANNQNLTVITEGSVQVDGTIGDVQLAGGTVSGTGNVGSITSTTGGSINPGDNYPTAATGTLHSTSTTLNGSNFFLVNLNGASSPTNDLLQLTGNINLGGATLGGSVANVAIGDSFTVIQTTGTVSGQLSGASTSPVAGGLSATIAYIGSTKFIVDYFTDHVVLTRALADTTLTLTASPAKGTKIRSFTFTAQTAPVPPGTGVPTGFVTFTDTRTGLVLGSAAVNSSGTATLVAALSNPNNPTTPIGPHSIRADYAGDTNFLASAGTTTVTVIANGTRASTVKLKSSNNPWISGSPVTFTATVRDAGPAPAFNPGGSVEFFDLTTNTLLGYGTLAVVSPGVTRTTLTTTALTTVETHLIQARYSGNGAFARSKTTLGQDIVAPPSRTTSTVLSTPPGQPSTAPFGTSLSFTATVADTGGGTLTPTGSVTFTDTTTGAVLGIVNLNPLITGQSQATLVTTALDVGTHDILATYNGSLDFAPGNPSAPLTETITQATSTLTLTSTANPSQFGQTISFLATMTSDSGAKPTGPVVFKDGGTVIATTFIDANGVATFTTNALPVGTHAITAEYAGNVNFTASNIGSLSQQVLQNATKAHVTPSTTFPNTRLVLTAVMKAVAPGTNKVQKPTGQVTFLIDGVNRGTINLVNNSAQLVLPNGLSFGTHKVVVQYTGDANNLTSTTTVFLTFGGR